MTEPEALFALALKKWIAEQKLKDHVGRRIFARILKRIKLTEEDMQYAESDKRTNGCAVQADKG